MADAANDMEEHGMVRTLKDLFAGAAGGIAQVLLGQFLSPSLYQPPSRFASIARFGIACLQKRGGITEFLGCR
jgi:hypothetical protein